MIWGRSSYFLLVSKGTKSSYGEDSYSIFAFSAILPFSDMPLLNLQKLSEDTHVCEWFCALRIQAQASLCSSVVCAL